MTPTNSVPTKRIRKGVSLAELIVASFVMSIVVFASYEVMRQGYSYFRSNETALDAQRDSLTLLTEFAEDVENSCLDYVQYDPSGTAITFLSPIDKNGIMNVDQAGKLYYQDIICYYIGTDHNVYRKNLFLPQGNSDSTTLTTDLNLYTASGYFIPTPVPGTRLLAHNIDQFLPQLGTAYGAAGGTRPVVNVTLYAGDSNAAQTEGYYVKVQSMVSPRNASGS